MRGAERGEVVVLAFVFGLGEESEAQGGEVMAVFGGAEGLGFESGHDVAPNGWLGGGREEEAAAGGEDGGDVAKQLALVCGGEQEQEAPGEDAIEGAAEKGRVLDGFAGDGGGGEVAPERLDERGRGVDAIDGKAFGDQQGSEREAGATAEVEDGGPGGEGTGPLPDFGNANADVAGAAAAGEKLGGNLFVSVGPVSHE